MSIETVIQATALQRRMSIYLRSIFVLDGDIAPHTTQV